MDVIEDGKTGYLFNTGDGEDLARQIEKFILLSSEEKAAMGVAGRKKVEVEFDRRIVIDTKDNRVLEKRTYTALTLELMTYLKENKIKDIYIVYCLHNT